MENQNNYLEIYPIYETLRNDIELQIDKNIKYIELEKGVSAYGKIIYDKEIENVKVEYSLQNGQYLKQLIDKINEIYKNYCDINIDVKLNNDTIINKMNKSCNIIVRIPCEFNKKCYLTLDIIKKQQLRLEAVNNIRNGLVTFEDSKKI